MKTDVRCLLNDFLCGMWKWLLFSRVLSEGELPFTVGCVIPLLTQTVSSPVMTEGLLAFLGAQRLRCANQICFSSLSLCCWAGAMPLYALWQ